MTLNRKFWTDGLIVVCGILLVVSLGCTKSSLKEMSLFRGDRDSQFGVLGENNSHPADGTALVWHDSFEDANASSAMSGKPILAVFTGSDWCQPCMKLKENVFGSGEFKTWAQENVALLEVDFPRRSLQTPMIKKQNSMLAKKYSIQAYPTVLFLNAQGKVLGKLGYEKDPGVWVESAREILGK